MGRPREYKQVFVVRDCGKMMFVIIAISQYHKKSANDFRREDGGEIGGRGVHFPLAPVKYLADLRNTVNSQWYSSIYED